MSAAVDSHALPPAPVAWLVEHARPILLRHLRPDSCIESTAAALDFLRRQGISGRELSVTVQAFNEPAWTLVEAGVMPNDEAGAAVWEMRNAWSIGVGYFDGPVPPPGRFGGHLVAVVHGARWLVDLSIDQASRPEKGLTIRPTVIRFGAIGKPETSLTAVSADGVLLVYGLNRSPWAELYRAARGWRSAAQRKLIADELCAAYQSALGGSR